MKYTLLIFNQIGDIKQLLDTETITVIGLLLAICGLLIWDKVRQEKKYRTQEVEQEKKYQSLMHELQKEQNENKIALIDIVSRNILATEQNTQAINTIREIYKNGSR